MIAPATPSLVPDDRPELMTSPETIAYLRLDVDGRDPSERLRSLCRYQGLPRIKRGKLILFRRADVDAWLGGRAGKRK